MASSAGVYASGGLSPSARQVSIPRPGKGVLLKAWPAPTAALACGISGPGTLLLPLGLGCSADSPSHHRPGTWKADRAVSLRIPSSLGWGAMGGSDRAWAFPCGSLTPSFSWAHFLFHPEQALSTRVLDLFFWIFVNRSWYKKSRFLAEMTSPGPWQESPHTLPAPTTPPVTPKLRRCRASTWTPSSIHGPSPPSLCTVSTPGRGSRPFFRRGVEVHLGLGHPEALQRPVCRG